MNHDVHLLHHVGLVVTDMAATIARYEQLGFQFTPLSLPKIPLHPGGEPEVIGAGNRTAIFQNNYLEILAVVERKRWETITRAQRGPYDLDGPLSRYEGLHVMHFGTDDLASVDARLTREGIPHADITSFQRLVETPAGGRMMQARALHFPPGSNPEALLQIAQHLTPELVLQPRYMHHSNGAKSVTACIVCTNDPEEVVERYEHYTGHKREQAEGIDVVNLGDSRVLVLTPEQLEGFIPGSVPPALPSLVGFIVAVADLQTPRSLLTRNQIPFQEVHGRCIVRSQDACGCAVLFEAQGRDLRSGVRGLSENNLPGGEPAPGRRREKVREQVRIRSKEMRLAGFLL